ncbi:hypothetical protein D092_01645 [Rhodococcus ruber Chol-4]|nr:hypothetical protein D092_01645 [Rhodococcus ruber Chol-4]
MRGSRSRALRAAPRHPEGDVSHPRDHWPHLRRGAPDCRRRGAPDCRRRGAPDCRRRGAPDRMSHAFDWIDDV